LIDEYNNELLLSYN